MNLMVLVAAKLACLLTSAKHGSFVPIDSDWLLSSNKHGLLASAKRKLLASAKRVWWELLVCKLKTPQ